MLALSSSQSEVAELCFEIEAVSLAAPGGECKALTNLDRPDARLQLEQLLQTHGPQYLHPTARPQIPRPLARSSGVTRASSAPRACIYACLAAKVALESVRSMVPTAAIALSTTSSLDAAQRHEIDGLQNGWETVDPFLLPYAIPSAIATQVAAVSKAHAGAICLTDGFRAFDQALMFSWAFLRSGADRVILVASEQVVASLADSLLRNGVNRVAEGAAVLILRAARIDSCTSPALQLKHTPELKSTNVLHSTPTVGTSLDTPLELLRQIASFHGPEGGKPTAFHYSRSAGMLTLSVPNA